MSRISIRQGWFAGLLVLPLLLAARGDGQPLSAPRPATFAGNSDAAAQVELPDGRRLVVNRNGLQLIASGRDTILAGVAGRAFASATLLPNGKVLIWGGLDASGGIIDQGLWFDPVTDSVQVADEIQLIPLAGHSVTVLTDGKVLVSGGWSPRYGMMPESELWDMRSRHTTLVVGQIEPPRIQPQLNLESDGSVSISRGFDANGSDVSDVLAFDPVSTGISRVGTRKENGRASLPSMSGAVPADGATDVTASTWISMRFSVPMDPTSLTGSTVTVLGPEGAASGIVTPVDNGRVVFFVPQRDLLPGSRYTVFVSGARSPEGAHLPFVSLGFTTLAFTGASNQASSSNTAPDIAPPAAHGVGSPTLHLSTGPAVIAQVGCSGNSAPGQVCRDQAIVDHGAWLPGRASGGGHWRVNGAYPLVPHKGMLKDRSLSASATGIYGQVLRVDDVPVSNVSVSVADVTSQTDARGVFVLTGVQTGHQKLVVDGSTANHGSLEYGSIVVGVDIANGEVKSLPQALFLPRILAQDKVAIPSPTTAETVITHPEIPGLEIHIPANTVIRDRAGHPLTELAIVPMPADRSPVPLPANFPVYFSMQPGGATAHALSRDASTGVRIVYPHEATESPNGTYDFWIYDPENNGWKVYSQGHVSADGQQILADSTLGPHSFMPGGYSVGGPTPPNIAPPTSACGDSCDVIGGSKNDKGSGASPCAPGCAGGADSAGDPVDSATGLFIYHRTDFAINDVLPIRFTRTYRSMQPTPFAFGPGTSMNYGMYLYTSDPNDAPSDIFLVLPDGEKVDFFIISGNLRANGPGTWWAIGSSGRFNGAILTNVENGLECGICITLKDGTVYAFPPFGSAFNPSYVQAVHDRFGNRLTFSYNGNYLTQVTSPSGRYIQLAYNASNKVQQITDNSGRAVSYSYDPSGRLSTVTYPDANSTTEKYTYDNNGNMLTAIDRNGKTILTNEYDASQRVHKQTLADSTFYQWAYGVSDPSGYLATEITDPRGSVRHVAGASGLPVSVTEAYGASIAQKTTFARQAEDSQPTSVTDPMGRVTTSIYEGLTAGGGNSTGNLLSRTYLSGTPNAVTYSYAYSLTYHQLETVTDPLGHTTTFGYDSRGCLTSVTDAMLHSTTLTCNSAGQTTSIANAAGSVTTLGYLGKDLHTVTDPLNRTTTLTTDNLGRVTAITDPMGFQVQLQYDTDDRVVAKIDATNKTTSLAYDGDGDLLSIIDPNNGETQWGYDPRNRVTSRMDALLNLSEFWTYDGMNNVLTHSDRKNQTTHWQYDLLNRPSLITYADGSTTIPTFDTGNRMTQLQDSVSGNIIRTLDNFDRVTQVQTPQGTIDYGYDVVGRRTLMTPANQASITYTYDNANRLTSISQGSENVGFAYDNANRRTALTLPNGIITGYSYDRAGQLAGVTYRTQTGVQLSTLGYTYDADGQRTSKSGGFAADLLPSPTSGASSFDLNNRQTQANGVSLTYDANGNLTGDGSNTYTWDARNHLVQIAQGTTIIATFNYDVSGRRISKTVGGTTTQYLYDGWNAIQETQGASNYPILSGMGMDERFARSEIAGRYYFLTDTLGSTLALADGNGAIQQTYGYGPYGAAQSAGSSNNPYQYTGRENDGTGLYYYRARYYSPGLQRFISEDPIGLTGGTNTYSYALNSPTVFNDPSGNSVDLNLHASYDPSWLNANTIWGPPGTYVVDGHGNPSSMRDSMGDLSEHGPWMFPNDLASWLQLDSNYQFGEPVLLISCSVGQGENSFAQRLADILHAPVTAADGLVYTDSNGAYYPAAASTDIDRPSLVQQTPSWITFYPR